MLVYPLVALGLATLGTSGSCTLRDPLERERVRGLFARIVPESVVGQVLARTDEDLRLGAVERLSTVLFTTCGASPRSRKASTPAVLEVVNFYLSEMTAAILGAGGTLIGYLGDGIMALFGAPSSSAITPTEHRGGAGDARPAAGALQRSDERAGIPSGFRMGIGLTAGSSWPATSAATSGWTTPRSATRPTPRRGSRG